jgi:hypothetical protein
VDFRTTTILFFYKKETEPSWPNIDFANQGVSLKIMFESTLFCEINLESKYLYLSQSIVEVENILHNLKIPVDLEYVELTIDGRDRDSKPFNLEYIPRTVTKLDLNIRGVDWETMEKFLDDRNIHELIYKPEGTESVVVNRLPKSLRVFSLFRCQLSVSPSYLECWSQKIQFLTQLSSLKFPLPKVPSEF